MATLGGFALRTTPISSSAWLPTSLKRWAASASIAALRSRAPRPAS